ncbi:pyrimidine reductase family protein [Pseudosporangium ferrugineum]|uniref:Riboflavin biosynthesis pyrimidine reductase n=1 Tax=Pseudosporangium ferrugineum TaxID=439699 RepID=A0A2T0RU43_9ACTN|nr:pyrimidine reductase family protein [Pseudosporangium ferrugineum]PRY24719.1 riboflavin biosynthesis pyrimidine reductase [Pseudosporangium ferrugineum]
MILEELLERYPRAAEPTLRVNFIASIDGAVTVGGKSGALGGPADKRIFDFLRTTCDALVVAAGTVRAEHYDALRLDEAGRAWRRARGLPEFPLMVVVSGSLDLDPDQLIFSDAPIRPLVVTRSGSTPPPGLADVAEILTLGDGEVDLAAMVAELHRRGATRVLCEGGPRLFGALIAADLVDEVCLTVSPLLTGGAAGRIAAGPEGPPRRMVLRGVVAEDDLLFLRYARSGPQVVDNPVDDP